MNIHTGISAGRVTLRGSFACLLVCVTVVSTALAPLCPSGSARAQTSLEDATVDAIRADALSTGHPKHPLPLVSGWMDGRNPLGFTPKYQQRQIQSGRYLLPWVSVYQPPPANESVSLSAADRNYYESAVEYLAAHHLPICITTSEWEVIMSRLSPEYAGGNSRQPPMSPFGSSAPWYLAGRAWARHPAMRFLERQYPDPPLVLIVQDSEYPRLWPKDLEADVKTTLDPDLIAWRRSIGDAWISKYRALLKGFKEGLEKSAWRNHVIEIGYDQFPSSAIGRWPGWIKYSLYIPGRAEPWPSAWDGASVSYYQHDYWPDSDFTVWSPQIEAMNWVAELGSIQASRPGYWFELSTWDGQQRGQRSDKLQFYARSGRRYSPARYGGMIQFGMWLLRPRVLREFRNPTDDVATFGPYFSELLDAVAKVHKNPILAEFWNEGRLLENRIGRHPYEAALPAEFAARPRWFLLESDVNLPQPWSLFTQLRMYALALEDGTPSARRWLIYAFTPDDDLLTGSVVIPNGPRVEITGARSGAFTLVTEEGTKLQRVE